MPTPKSAKNKSTNGGANLGFEATLWAAADKLRGHMDAAEYKHVVLGLIFLKYISDSFEEKHAQLAQEKNANPEDRDEYVADHIFWVPPVENSVHPRRSGTSERRHRSSVTVEDLALWRRARFRNYLPD